MTAQHDQYQAGCANSRLYEYLPSSATPHPFQVQQTVVCPTPRSTPAAHASSVARGGATGPVVGGALSALCSKGVQPLGERARPCALRNCRRAEATLLGLPAPRPALRQWEPIRSAVSHDYHFRVCAREQLEHHNAGAVDIGRSSQALARLVLRVAEVASPLHDGLRERGGHLSRDADVPKECIPVFQKNILRLDVPMDDGGLTGRREMKIPCQNSMRKSMLTRVRCLR